MTTDEQTSTSTLVPTRPPYDGLPLDGTADRGLRTLVPQERRHADR